MEFINLRGVQAEDFCNYKEPSMFLVTSYCDFKCCHEGNFPESVCQNEPLIKGSSIHNYKIDTVVKAYVDNPITKAIVIGGLEPMLQFEEIVALIKKLREYNNDPVIIYTGYYPCEIEEELRILKSLDNITVKFGRYIPDQEPHFDSVLGVSLASNNQYAEVL